MIWVGNADITDQVSRDGVEDFSNAFALEPLCEGLTLKLKDLPTGPHWFLETYSVSNDDPSRPNAPNGISWWMVHGDDHKGWVEGMDKSAANKKADRCNKPQAFMPLLEIMPASAYPADPPASPAAKQHSAATDTHPSPAALATPEYPRRSVA